MEVRVKDRWWEKTRWGEIEPPYTPESLTGDDNADGAWNAMWELIYRAQGDGYDPEGEIGFIDEFRLQMEVLTDIVNEGYDITHLEIYPIFEYVMHKWAELVKAGKCKWIDLEDARANFLPTDNNWLVRDIGFVPDRKKHWWWYVLED